VEHLKLVDVDGKADLWTMSPPCQPFTTNGKNKQCLGMEDKRCNGLKSLIQLLHHIREKPRWILLENVQGFAESAVVQEWYACLQANGYSHKSYLLSPIQFGIPNHRLRFYVLAERSLSRKNERGICRDVSSFTNAPITQHTVGDYLEDDIADMKPFLVPDSALEKKFAQNLGMVSTADTATHCFTAGYGRIYHRSTGSLLPLKDQNDKVAATVSAVADVPLDRTDMLQYAGRLRRFTPRELLAMFGFLQHFEFPDDISLEHQHKLIGNSISVLAVTALMHELLLLGKEEVEPSAKLGEQHPATAACNKQQLLNNWSIAVGGTKGHVKEEIHGNLLKLYQHYRWKMIPNCTGRYTCRDHNMVSSLSPIELLERAQITPLHGASWRVFSFDLPGRRDQVLVIPMDVDKHVGLITFVKRQDDAENSYVHTLNTPSGFRRKLEAIGIQVSSDYIHVI
jgi:tRNA (cytosine38-C5)-methyltransferase